MRGADDDDLLAARLRDAINALPSPATPIVLPRSLPRSGVPRPLRTAGMVGATTVALVGALVLGTVISERRAALASPQPTVGATADRYGLIVQSGGPVVRSEDDPAPIARLYSEPSHRGGTELWVMSAVSPDGHRVAYWIWGASPPGLGSLALTKLAVYDAITGTTRELLTLSSEAGSGVVWSTDGTGLLIGVGSAAVGFNEGPKLARLRTIDVATGMTQDIGPTVGSIPASRGPLIPGAQPPPSATQSPPGNVVFRPLFWDRAADRVVAVLAGPNTSYADQVMVIDHGAAHSIGREGDQFLADSVSMSPDGKTIAAARTRDFALVAWPVDDYAARRELVPASGERTLSLWWRPRSDQLYFVHDNALTNDATKWSRLEVWRPLVDSPRVVDPSSDVGGVTFRFDGSSYLLRRVDASAANSYELIESDSGRRLGSIPNVRIVGTLLLPGAPSSPITRGGPTSAPSSSSSLVVGDVDAIAPCAAAGNGPASNLVAAFVSTAGEIADWTENRSIPGAPSITSTWRSLPPTEVGYVCYFDGSFPVSRPPPPPGATGQPLPSRALIFVDATGSVRAPWKYADRSALPLVRRGDRF